MSFKLIMLRKINELTEENLAKQLNIDTKTIAEWENGDKEIDLNSAKIICDYFNVPKTYFLFNEDFDKIDYVLKKKISDYVATYIVECNAKSIINNCKKRINLDKIDFKKEYLPVFNIDNKNSNPSLKNYWEIIILLIDNGAYYTKQVGWGDDIVWWDIVKDKSRTNLVYRIAKDSSSK